MNLFFTDDEVDQAFECALEKLGLTVEPGSVKATMKMPRSGSGGANIEFLNVGHRTQTRRPVAEDEKPVDEEKQTVKEPVNEHTDDSNNDSVSGIFGK